MAFTLGTVTGPAFGSVPRSRTKYTVVTIEGNCPPGASIPTLIVSSDDSLMTPIAALGWNPVGTTVQRTPAATDFPLKLVVAFAVPRGGTTALPKLRVETTTEAVENTCSITVTAASTARISFVLDRSTSMGLTDGSVSRLTRATEGIRTALALMADQDFAELILFDTSPAPARMVRLGDSVTVGGRTLTRRQQILEALPTAPVTVSGTNIQGAVATADATSTAIIVCTDCAEDLGHVADLPRDDPKRFVLGVPNRRQSVFDNLGGRLGHGLSVLGAITADTQLLVQKFASQILLDATGHAIVWDPPCVLEPGKTVTYNFTATELDRSMKAIALTDRGKELEFRFVPGHAEPGNEGGGREPVRELPAEEVEQAYEQVQQPACVRTVVRNNMVLATLNLTPELREETKGRFHLQVRHTLGDKPIPFMLSLSADSDLRINSQLHATSLNVGATLLLSTVVSEAGVPSERATAQVELTYPDGGVSPPLDLEEVHPGRFHLRLQSMRPGNYLARFLVKGRTYKKTPFVREQFCTLTLGLEGEKHDRRSLG